MIVIPAVDIRGGRCVRLVQGRPEEETVFSDDPVAMAVRWTQEGAERLHVVNLDGALGVGPGENTVQVNRRIIGEMAAAVDVPIQLGGGLHSVADIEEAFALGVDRVILGTVAVEEPDVVAEAVRRHGAGRILVGIDGTDGVAVTHGWQRESQLSVLDLAQRMKSLGITRIVYTDVKRDGMLVGVNLEAVLRMARESGLRVIASGGVRSIDDVVALIPLEGDGVEGVIVGKALYTGAIDLREALEVSSGSARRSVGPDRGSP